MTSHRATTRATASTFAELVDDHIRLAEEALDSNCPTTRRVAQANLDEAMRMLENITRRAAEARRRAAVGQ